MGNMLASDSVGAVEARGRQDGRRRVFDSVEQGNSEGYRSEERG